MLVSVAAAVLYRQYLDLPAVLGIGLIIAGVVVIQLFSAVQATKLPADCSYTARPFTQ